MANTEFTVRPAAISDIPEIVNNMLPAGIEDCQRSGLHPVLSIGSDMRYSKTYVAVNSDDKIVTLFGFMDNIFWMHMTNEVTKEPFKFLKYAKRWFTANAKQPILCSMIDINNTALLKMAKSFGFKVVNVVPNGLNNTYYLQIVRLCHTQP